MNIGHNLIKDFHVRKMWKGIRRKVFRGLTPAKVDSDSLLINMRSKTDMACSDVVEVRRLSLEYYRDNNYMYRVRYDTEPVVFKKTHKQRIMKHEQLGFDELAMNGRCPDPFEPHKLSFFPQGICTEKYI